MNSYEETRNGLGNSSGNGSNIVLGIDLRNEEWLREWFCDLFRFCFRD